ncbi:ATP-binding protein [Actinosynnema sp. NPDC047251]|uniref:Putative membrane protein n=1 Tax=Saccharothrix espanaensis (strain ATCC 51144 / DSM 44229 / JCM 9112 / NBRC 15066 / NRRL 15764) TaxID=1179773 RepID=K0K5K4_SACES|nr:ATP-binding protein [Saccharothrix espanaensis]CCH32882.1 putative membrane protein [Saccharothrix espanaensis DSM 44229]
MTAGDGPAAKARTYRSAVERGIQRAFAVMSVAFALAAAVPDPRSCSPAVTATNTVFFVFLLVVATRAWRVRLGKAEGIIAAGITVAGDLARVVPAAEVPPAASGASIVTVVLLVGFHDRRCCLALVSVVTLMSLQCDAVVDGVAASIEGQWPHLAAYVTSYYLVPVLRLDGERADQAREALHRVHVKAAEAHARREAHRHFQRVLHDDIMSALRAVATMGLRRKDVRRAAAEAVWHAESLPDDTVGAPVELWPLLAARWRSVGIHVLPGRSDRVVVPSAVAGAVVAAHRELLRNVRRHARVDQVVVDLRADGAGFVLRVTDHGVGFRPNEIRGSSLGLRDSVLSRIGEVGGRVAVESEPGVGTSVELSWRPDGTSCVGADQKPDRARGFRAAVVDVRVPLYAACLPYLLGAAVPLTGRLGAAQVTPWLALWYAVFAVTVVAFIERARRPVGSCAAWAAALWAMISSVSASLMLPADTPGALLSWPIGAVGPLLLVLAVVRPWWEGVCAVLVSQTALGWAMATGHFVLAQPLEVVPLALAPVVGVVMGSTISVAIADHGRVAMGTDDERTRVATQAAGHDSRHALHASRLAGIGRVVLPFLAGVVDGRVALGDRRTQWIACELEHSTHDEMHIPGVLDDDARRVLNRARRAGCVITVQTDVDTLNPPAVVREVLTTTLVGGELPKEVVLSLYPCRGGTLVSLVRLPGSRAAMERLRVAFPAAELSNDTDAVEFELFVPFST